jgi:hypothetical protein
MGCNTRCNYGGWRAGISDSQSKCNGARTTSCKGASNYNCVGPCISGVSGSNSEWCGSTAESNEWGACCSITSHCIGKCSTPSNWWSEVCKRKAKGCSSTHSVSFISHCSSGDSCWSARCCHCESEVHICWSIWIYTARYSQCISSNLSLVSSWELNHIAWYNIHNCWVCSCSILVC